jgi:hypothetical protein
MANGTLGSSLRTSDMAKDVSFGRMADSTKVGGFMVNSQELVITSTIRKLSAKVFGKMASGCNG